MATAYQLPESYAPKWDVSVRVRSADVKYHEGIIESHMEYTSSEVRTKKTQEGHEKLIVEPRHSHVIFRTEARPRKTGLMMVGLGGNNGTTLCATLIANKLGLKWRTRTGIQGATWFGSLTQTATVALGLEERRGPNGEVEFEERFAPLKSLVPLLDPNSIVFDGWDITSLNLGEAMRRAQVLEPELQEQLYPELSKMKPRASFFDPDFVASNQADRADNLISGTRAQAVERIRKDIRDFREKNHLERVIVLWTANTERRQKLIDGVHDTADNLLRAIGEDSHSIAPSTLFGVATILENCSFINGSPQNSLVPGLVKLASSRGMYLSGDDFKTGQTKVKSALADFLIGAGIKVESVVSYNHLGNNDGKNLAEEDQFKSKEVSKSGVIEDLVRSNPLLYAPDEWPDHTIVIKYVPFVRDSKRAMDEYTSSIAMGGRNTLVLHNTCEDSLLAIGVMLDLVVLVELVQRVAWRFDPPLPGEATAPHGFHALLAPLLAYLLKAPAVPDRTPAVNSLFRQRTTLENFLKALVGLPPSNQLYLEAKLPTPALLGVPADVSGKEEKTPGITTARKTSDSDIESDGSENGEAKQD